MTLLHQAAQKAVEALQLAHAGLEWYRDGSPSYRNGCDDEADEKISDALVALESALQQQPEPATEPAWGITPPTLNRHVSPGITLGHELNRLRQYDAAALQQQEVPREPVALTDEQIIARCEAAGIKWIAPDEDEDGFPGSFDMVTMGEMRALLAASPSTTQQQEVGSEPQDCPVCKNGYLAIRTDIYKDGREFVYCDCCGCMADRRVWNRIAAAPSTPAHQNSCSNSSSTSFDGAPSTPENAGGVQGTKASSYKLLDHGDVIQCGDEVLADDTVNWLPLVGWEVGMKWGCNFMPMRRPAGVAVPQAPTVRQSSNQRDEKE